LPFLWKENAEPVVVGWRLRGSRRRKLRFWYLREEENNSYLALKKLISYFLIGLREREHLGK